MRLIVKFWRSQESRGEKMRPVWAIVSLGGVQPEGYIQGWSVSKSAALKMLDNLGAGSWRIARIG